MSTNIASPASDHRSSLLSAGLEYGNGTMLREQQQQLKLAVSCRDQVRAVTGHVNFVAVDQREKSPGCSRMVDIHTTSQLRGGGKRHYSFSADEKHGGFKQRRYGDRFGAGSVAVNFRKRGGRGGRHHPADRNEKFVLPTRFLLGGCITDPLNLNSLCDESVNRSMNENTPVSSPLPVPVHKLEVPVRMPTNTADPLNLNAVGVDIPEDQCAITQSWSAFKKRRKRNRRHKKMNVVMDVQPEPEELLPVKPLLVETDSKAEDKFSRLNKDMTETNSDPKAKRIIDHIVSPVIPQISPKWKRRRTTSESRPDIGEDLKLEDAEKPNLDRTTIVKHKKRNISQSQTMPAKFGAKNRKFCHGNYNRCVMSRNILGYYEDPRLNCFPSSMFGGKDVLDIGCNVGHVALSIARDFYPYQVVGLDIDYSLIAAAKKNLRNFSISTISESSKFPLAFRTYYGPSASHHLLSSAAAGSASGFPCNIKFLQSDYVPKSDIEVDQQQEEFDIILALNITKWIHLNNGDDGLKRAFRRMYHHLRPGGMLLLESQPWETYRKKKKLTPKIYRNYKSIHFHPEDFQTYLLSPQVGFASCRHLDVPSSIRTSVKHSILVFTKGGPNQLSGSHSVLTLAPELAWYHTRSQQFDDEQEQLMFSSKHVIRDSMVSFSDMPDDSTSSCSYRTPQFRVGSASCSTTPCCSTYCRNTPNAEDCSHEDYTTSVSFCMNNVVSSPSHDDSCSCDVYTSDSQSAGGLGIPTAVEECTPINDIPVCLNTSDFAVQYTASNEVVNTCSNESESRTVFDQ